MEIQHYNRLKATNEQVQSEVHFCYIECEQPRSQVKIVLAEKELAHASLNRWAIISVPSRDG